MAEGAHQLTSDSADKCDILGIGMSILDSFQVVEEFPSEGGVTEVTDTRIMGGGPVPTALCAAAKLGARVGVIDRIGDDWRGEMIRDEYDSFGVDTRNLVLENGRRSSFGTVLVRRRDGERHVIFHAGDFSIFDEEELPVDDLKQCRFLHLNGRHWPACIAAARIVCEAGGKVSFDGGAHRYDPKCHELLPLVDILIVARDFAEKLSSSTDRSEQLSALSQWDVEIVGITDGENGSWFATSDGEKFHQPAFAVERVVDTTGCGDAFHGAFLFARDRGDDWKTCARIASAAAALNTTALGGRGHLATLPEVEARIAST